MTPLSACLAVLFYERGDTINSFMFWVGGKKALRDQILSRFSLDYKRYGKSDSIKEWYHA